MAGSTASPAAQARSLSAPALPSNTRTASARSSGTLNTASCGPSGARRKTGVPAARTAPGSASTAVTTPDPKPDRLLVVLQAGLGPGLASLRATGLQRGLAALKP